ncbi:hypothetical protein DSO57_1011806 [Entomophthora muscae]|uniref:Uncharacterized protein n=1 Tax=Entomophthora muscae TaxID=34485 RepID=A0ACC2UFI8_9FUNG|nr:hypothetical protein DSO57_1011806 [Entomophthora muscae]
MSSMLKATNILKTRQVSNAVRDIVASNIYRITAPVLSGANVGDRCHLYYEAESPINFSHPSYFSSISNSNPVLSLTKVPNDPSALPPSPTTENNASNSNGITINSELASLELPFFSYPTRPVVNNWIDQNVGMRIHPLQQFYFDYGVTGIPKTNLRPTFPDEDRFHLSKGFGEDACFIRRDSLGVADGVGGWKKIKGILLCFMNINQYHRG